MLKTIISFLSMISLQCRISNLFLWSSNSIVCLCFCCSEKERKCLIKVPKKPQDLALQNCVGRIFFLCLVFIIFACLAISSKQRMVLLMHEMYGWATGTTTKKGHIVIQISSQTTKKSDSENPQFRTQIRHKLLSLCETHTFAPVQLQALRNSRN